MRRPFSSTSVEAAPSPRSEMPEAPAAAEGGGHRALVVDGERLQQLGHRALAGAFDVVAVDGDHGRGGFGFRAADIAAGDFDARDRRGGVLRRGGRRQRQQRQAGGAAARVQAADRARDKGLLERSCGHVQAPDGWGNPAGTTTERPGLVPTFAPASRLGMTSRKSGGQGETGCLLDATDCLYRQA
jgi:hypothetical protein